MIKGKKFSEKAFEKAFKKGKKGLMRIRPIFDNCDLWSAGRRHEAYLGTVNTRSTKTVETVFNRLCHHFESFY